MVHDYDLNQTYAFDSNTFVVLIVQNEPFIFKNSQGQWDGFCFDILKEIARELGISFLIREMPVEGDIYSTTYNGSSNLVYKWSGAIGELLDDVNRPRIDTTLDEPNQDWSFCLPSKEI